MKFSNKDGDLHSIHIALLFQCLLFGIFLLNIIGLQFPESVQIIIGIIYLTFIPGYLILTLLKLYNIEFIEKILISVGLSIAYLIFSGFALNFIGPLIGLNKPLSIAPISIMLFISTLLISLIIYKQKLNNNQSEKKAFINLQSYYKLKNINPIFFLLIVFIIAIIGPYTVNFYSLNTVQIFFIILVSLTVFLALFKIFIPSKLYIFALWIISVSLILHWALISKYLVGCDIQLEYYVFTLVEKGSYWNQLIYPENTNSVLSVTIFPIFYSKLFNINGVWIFKFLIPFIFSLVPVGLFITYRKFLGNKLAFLSVFYFMSLSSFFGSTLSVAKQMIAMFFLSLLLIVIFNDKISPIKKSTLLILFMASLIVSHYGTSYLFLLICLIYLIFITILKYKSQLVTPTLVILTSVFAFSWYMYTTYSSLIITITGMTQRIYTNFFTDLFNVGSRELGRAIISETAGSLYFVNRMLNIAMIIFVVLGVLLTILPNRRKIFQKDFLYLSLSCFIVFIFLVTAPNFSGFDTARIRQITAMLLSPFFILGIIYAFNIGKWLLLDIPKKFLWCIRLKKGIDDLKINSIPKIYIKIVSIVLILFFLFTSKFVYAIAEQPSSITLDKKFDFVKYNDQEQMSASWLYNSSKGEHSFADFYGVYIFIPFFGEGKVKVIEKRENEPLYAQFIRYESYLFLRQINIEEKKILVSIVETWPKITEYVNVSESKLFFESNIYVNGGSKIIHTSRQD